MRVETLRGYFALATLVVACSPHREFSPADGSGGSGGSGGKAGTGGGVGGGGNDSAGGEPSAGSPPSTGGVAGAAGDDAGGGTSSGMAGAPIGGSDDAGDPCAIDPCINGGECTASGDRAVCSCLPGYGGDRCEVNVDDCASSPCQNAGTCVDGIDKYTCTCTTGFSGERCERVVSKCADRPCLNGGTCADQAGSYKCTCGAGYSGTNCEVNVDECAASPCKNGAACVDGVNAYTCQCKAGYTGTTCQTNIDECATNPCKNDGACVDGVNAYTCQCKTGFTGTTCQTNINDCANNPCQNSGTCVDGTNAYTCTCTSRYTGPKCEYLEVKLVPSNFLPSYTTTATALSNDGKVLLMNFADTSGHYGFGRLVDFESANSLSLSAPLSDGSAFGIDTDGSTVVGEADSDGVNKAFKRAGTTSALLDLSPIAGTNDTSRGLDVSADGTTTVGSIYSGGGTTAFYCKSGQACRRVAIDVTNWIEQAATSVNADGTVVVGYSSPADSSAAGGSGAAWRWVTSNSKATILSLSSSTWTYPHPNAVSRNGLVVVGQVEINGVSHAVRWSGSSFSPTDLGTGRATGTNADGSVTVGIDNSGVPVVWLGTTRQTLASLLGSNPDLSGVTLSTLVAVSDDGKVVAGTAKVNGADRAFMARLP